MGLFLGDTGPSKVFVGGNQVSSIRVGENKVRPTFKERTFTISRTEQSNMSSGWTYSDDAAGLTAGSTDFDEFFGYSAVRLSAAGVETTEVTQKESGGPGKLDFSQLGTLTSGDNVMIKFPRRGIKMSKSGSVVTLSITEKDNEPGYQYYAHSRGTFSSPISKNYFYMSAFKAYNNSKVLKSWSGKSPTTSISYNNCLSYARANDGNNGSGGYDMYGFYQRMYINALYIMKYGNPNCQSTIGLGYVGGSAKTNTGGTISQLNATYATSSNTVQCKLFGIEDRWGNTHDRLGGANTNGSKYLYTALSGFAGITTSSPYESTGSVIQNSSGNDMSSIVGDNKSMFAPNASVSNSNFDTYYCDYVRVAASRIFFVGGRYGTGTNPGIFNGTYDYNNTTGTDGNVGTRIMYL